MTAEQPTILVIDDEEPLRRLLGLWLQEAGFQVRQAGTRQEALGLLDAGIDLVVCDIVLPDGNGLDLCREIKSLPRSGGGLSIPAPALPVLLLSGFCTSSEEKTIGLDTGGDGYLVKPLHRAELVATVRSLLRIRAAERAAQVLAQQWQTTFDGIQDGILLLDAHDTAVRCNRALLQLLQCSPRDILGCNWAEIVWLHLHRSPEVSLLDLPRSPGRASMEIQLTGEEKREPAPAADAASSPTAPGGNNSLRSQVWLAIQVDPLPAVANVPAGTVCLFTDISTRKQAELLQSREWRLREEAHLRQLHLQSTALASAANAIFITDRHGRIEWANLAFSRLSGYPMDELLGQTPRVLHSGVQDRPFYDALWRTILTGQVWTGEVVERRKDGEMYVVQQTVTPLVNEVGQVSHFVAIHEDITARKEAEARVQHLAFHDVLTDLPNRALFQNRIPAALANARRHQNLVAIHFIDLDGFKMVNDTLGHAVGDALLKQVARRLQGCLRAADTVARLGGDEFAILQTDLHKVDGASVLARKVLETLAAPFNLEGQEVHMSASIGITVYPLDEVEPAQLVQNADLAMYHAKREGKHNFQFYTTTLNEKMRNRLELERDLRMALSHNQLTLHYQPQVSLQQVQGDTGPWSPETARLVGVEALMRWRHPTRGLVSPAEFIPVAEESGLIDAVTRWLLHEACRQNQAWQQAGLTGLRMAVNVSAHNFKRGILIDTVREALAASHLPGHFLELEMTETVLISESDVARTIQELHPMGVAFSIDDFGTGYSSMNYLRTLRVDKLKIDRSFVSRLPGDRDGAVIARAIVDLSHGLELRVIAEGIETIEQARKLQEWGCDEGQGFLFSPPLPADALSDFLARKR